MAMPPADNRLAALFITTLALTKSAGVALPAAFFIHHGGFTALGAQVTDLHFLHGDLVFNRVTRGAVAVRLSLIRAAPLVLWTASLIFQPGQRTGLVPQVHIDHLADAIG